MPDIEFQPDDPRTGDVASLLETHLAFARQVTPPEDVHALDVDGLLGDDVSFFSARRDGQLLAVGALRHLDETHVEIKSMHTAAAARRLGIGRAMLEHLVATGRVRGYTRISLETGMMDAFTPARTMYETYGFEQCEPFGQYQAKVNSICMTLYV